LFVGSISDPGKRMKRRSNTNLLKDVAKPFFSKIWIQRPTTDVGNKLPFLDGHYVSLDPER
jgi:hypothetical protein